MLFKDKYRFLSNFYPCKIRYKGKTYDSTEHAYQAAKFDDEEVQELIRNCSTPGKAKRAARKHTPKPDWDKDMSVRVMDELLRLKFEDRLLSQKLVEIDEPIIEHNTWGDTFWGVCDGKGKNVLGKLLERLKMEKNVFWVD